MDENTIYTIIDTWEVSSNVPDCSVFNYTKREDALKAFTAILNRADVVKDGKAYGYDEPDAYDVEELFDGMAEGGWSGFKYGDDGDSILYVRCRPVLQKYDSEDFE